jgi:hypothetical protein
MRRHLQAWLDFFESNERLSATASRTMALTLAPDELAKPLTAFSSRVEEQNFKRIEAWEIEQRRQMLAELQSMRRLEYLMSELNQWFAKIPGSVFYPTPDRILSSAEFPTGI